MAMKKFMWIRYGRNIRQTKKQVKNIIAKEYPNCDAYFLSVKRTRRTLEGYKLQPSGGLKPYLVRASLKCNRKRR